MDQEEQEGSQGEQEVHSGSRKVEKALCMTDLPPGQSSNFISSPAEPAATTSTNSTSTTPSNGSSQPCTPSEPSSASETYSPPAPPAPPTPGVGADPAKPRQGKAKEARKARRAAKHEGKEAPTASKEQGRSVDDWLGLEWGEGAGAPAHTFSLRLVPCDDSDQVFRDTFDESLAVYQAYQQVIMIPRDR